MKTQQAFINVTFGLLLLLFPSIQAGHSTAILSEVGKQANIDALSYPPDPISDISWSAGTSGIADIQAAFNSARGIENGQLGISIPMLTLPGQGTWDSMSDGEKALWLINRERIDRGIMPLDGLETNVMGIAQNYADYLLTNNVWGHSEDGNSPWDRLNSNPSIGSCHDFLPIAENLSVFVTSSSSIPLPIERTIYMWLYDDKGSNWGHRHTVLWYPYSDNSGVSGEEGFLGIGRANGGSYKGPFEQSWPYAEIIVMNVFDPCNTWVPPAPRVSSIVRTNPNPTIATKLAFDVTFTQSVTGVDQNDFNITAAGIASPSISAINGSENTYTVIVDTGSGFGTLRLDLVDNDSIVNDSNIPLGGRGSGNGSYTDGEIYDISTFADVPTSYWAWRYVESIYLGGITGGCGSGIYCPEDPVTRAQMAVFLERGIHGSAFTPAVVPISFTDTNGHWAQYWIEALKADGITGGCGTGIYCPDDPVTRAQMAVFLLKSKYGAGYTPPALGAGTGFSDVPASHWAAAWIKQLAAEGITGGCGSGTYCPEDPVTRAQMAIFLQKSFNLTLP